ncbi:MAG TPA: hypothetical protein VLH12_14545 [Usitatibacter sp.]|nr:hypothetical protein [Usitatibacter sp.]
MKRRTWNLTIVSAAVCSAFIATPADALTPLQPLPMSAKYRDNGAKPASGRSGSAAIEARALLGADGTTDLEVTTGHFEGGAAVGSLSKVQVKVLANNGRVLTTDNYRKTLTGAGFASFTYDGLYHGQPTQVQASVAGIDGTRTDIVTVSTDVKLRPDLVASVNAQSVATVNSMVVVGAVMTEKNGDVGARATCRLLVDDAEVASIPGAWVDAASAVTCRFTTSFATVGTKRLTVRITDVSPRDFDTANNEAIQLIDVVPPQPLDYMYAEVYQFDGYEKAWQQTTNYKYDGSIDSQWSSSAEGRGRAQTLYIEGGFFGPAPMEGQITLRHSTGTTILPMLAFSVADLPLTGGFPGYSCRSGNYPGTFVYFCTSAEVTDVFLGQDAGDATYTVTGGVYSGWLNPSTAEWIDFGPSYTADLRYEANGIAHEMQIGVGLYRVHVVRGDASPNCSYYSYPDVYQVYCSQWTSDYVQVGGETYFYDGYYY